MDQPIACSLPPADLRARRATIDELTLEALLARAPIVGGVRLTFAAGPGTEQSLRALIAAEAQCCSFLRMDLGHDDDVLTLDITGPGEAQPIIAEMFT
jgi:hypothetical protein